MCVCAQRELVTFDSDAQGQVAMVIYEWGDVDYLGKVTSATDEGLPVSMLCHCCSERIQASEHSRRPMSAQATPSGADSAMILSWANSLSTFRREGHSIRRASGQQG